MPRLGHRLLFACLHTPELRGLVSGALLEAAIRRDEQRFRDASDDKLARKLGTKFKGDPARAFAAYPLLNVWGEWGRMLGNTEPPPMGQEQLLFAYERAACVPDLGMRAFEPASSRGGVGVGAALRDSVNGITNKSALAHEEATEENSASRDDSL